MEKIRPELHDLIGGILCLDFSNTKNGHRGTVFHEFLFDYRDLVAWGLHTGILNEEKLAALLQKACEYPAAAESAFQKAINLREVIFRVFSTFAGGNMPESTDLDWLNALRVEALGNARLIHDGKCRFIYGYRDDAAFDYVTWTIAISAVELLTSDTINRVRECDGKNCDWLFIDNSRNHLRRWCSMEECGNRSKMRRRYARTRMTTP